MVVRWKFGEGRTKIQSLFKPQRSFLTCSSPPTTADGRRAPGRQLTAGSVLRPAGFSPPPKRSLSSGLGVRSNNGVIGPAHRRRQHTASRRFTADQSPPPGLGGVQGLKGADRQLTSDQQLTPDRTFCRQDPHRRPFAPIQTQSAKPRWRHRLLTADSNPPSRPLTPTSRSHPRLGAGGHNADDSRPALDDSLLPADFSPPTGGVKPQWRRRRRAGGGGRGGKDKEGK